MDSFSDIWGPLGPFGDQLGSLWGPLGLSGVIWESCWAHLGAIWGYFGIILDSLSVIRFFIIRGSFLLEAFAGRFYENLICCLLISVPVNLQTHAFLARR